MHRLLSLLLLLSLTGCAVFNRDNTPALNFVEAKLVPKDPVYKAASYPVTVPLSLVAVTLDMLLLRPISVLPDAADDTGDCLWSNLDWKGKYFTSSASLVPRAAFTPVIFTGSLLGRSLFDISHVREKRKLSEETERKGRERARLVAEGRRMLQEQRPEQARECAEQALKIAPFDKDALELKGVILLQSGKIDEFVDVRGMPWDGPIQVEFVKALQAASSADRIRLLYFLQRHGFYNRQSEQLLKAVAGLASDQDRVVRGKALELLGGHASTPVGKSALEQAAASDDPVLSAIAKGYLHK